MTLRPGLPIADALKAAIMLSMILAPTLPDEPSTTVTVFRRQTYLHAGDTTLINQYVLYTYHDRAPYDSWTFCASFSDGVCTADVTGVYIPQTKPIDPPLT